jgi:beta-mannosidase
MFRTWYGDIRRFLSRGENTIRIRFPSIPGENKSRYSKYRFRLPGDERVVCRKAAYHFGWDWGPTFITSGIWKPIYIKYWDFVNLLGVQYLQQEVTDSAARMTAVFTLTSVLPDTALFRIRQGTDYLVIRQAPVNKGINVIRVDFSIPHPKRWWSNGLGEPYLYPLTHEILFGGRLSVSGTIRIGIRTLELVEEMDSTGKSFYFRLNGVPVFMKGANYIPQDNFLPRVTDSAYRALIRSAADAHMNMLRVWGGGIYEKDIFYDLCDEYGILVWQDFMFANTMVPNYKEFNQNVNAEAIQNVVRLRNHPCIALWCGNNEIDEGWKNWGWQKQYGYSPEDSTAIWRDYRVLFEITLRNDVSFFDSLTPYIPSSPRFGWGRPQSLTTGDSHYWGVWWGKEPFSTYEKKVGRFMSEYGFQGFPSMRTIRKFTKPEDRVPGSPVMKAHQKHPTGYELIDEYLLRDYRKPKDFESYAYVSQLLQAEGITRAAEAHRRAMPWCMGTLYWQLNDCWPVVSWSSRDYYGEPKALHYFIKKSYRTLLLSAAMDSSRLKLYVVSDSLESFPANLRIRLMTLTGEILSEHQRTIRIPGNSSFIAFDTLAASILEGKDPANLLLYAELKAGENILATDHFFFTEPKDLKLPPPEISKKITLIPEGFRIALTSKNLAKNVFLSCSLKGTFTDNYFDLLPGETRILEFRTGMKPGDFASQLKIMTLTDTY